MKAIKFAAATAAAVALWASHASAVPTTSTANASAKYQLSLSDGVMAFVGQPVIDQTYTTAVGDFTGALSLNVSIVDTDDDPCDGDGTCFFAASSSINLAVEDGEVAAHSDVSSIVVSFLLEDDATLTITNLLLDVGTTAAVGDGIGASAQAGAFVRNFSLTGFESFFVVKNEVKTIDLVGGEYTLTWNGVRTEGAAKQSHRSNVPEPATLALFGLGMLGLGLRRRAA